MARLNLLDLVETQRSERYRAIIIHAAPMSGKTETARCLAERLPDAVYIDFLTEFLQHPDWCAELDLYRLIHLSDFLLGLDAPGQVIIIDHLDFLLHTWSRNQKRSLVQWVDEGLDGFTKTDKIFIFFVQSDQDMTDYPLRRPNRDGHKRVFGLADFSAL